ncbi:MAG: hypothetical protein KDA81_07790, partial [Planctomycetaceae bacterium]|nr:hypothetical protein [Planctomycetaceae bacterium]
DSGISPRASMSPNDKTCAVEFADYQGCTSRPAPAGVPAFVCCECYGKTATLNDRRYGHFAEQTS